MIAYVVDYKDDLPIYEVEDDNGEIATDVLELPEEFGKGDISLDQVEEPKPHFLYTFRSHLGRTFNNIEDFECLAESDEYHKFRLSGEDWRSFAITFLKQLVGVVRANYIKLPDPAQHSSNPLSRLLFDLSLFISGSWTELNPGYSERFDIHGIKSQLASLNYPEERIDFLRQIDQEMKEVCEVVFKEYYDPLTMKSPVTEIRLRYRHALLSSDLDRVRLIMQELERTYVSDVLSEIQCRREALSKVKEVEEERIPVTANLQRPKWICPQVDLIFIVDCLKKAGYISVRDAEIPEIFSFESSAKDVSRNLRNLRLKVNKGESHPQRDKLLLLMNALEKGIR